MLWRLCRPKIRSSYGIHVQLLHQPSRRASLISAGWDIVFNFLMDFAWSIHYLLALVDLFLTVYHEYVAPP